MNLPDMHLKDITSPTAPQSGLFYHVISRHRTLEYFSQTDRLRRLSIGSGRFATLSLFLAWALMSNHIHLLVLSGVRIVSLMHPLLTGYATAFGATNASAIYFTIDTRVTICEEDPFPRTGPIHSFEPRGWDHCSPRGAAYPGRYGAVLDQIPTLDGSDEVLRHFGSCENEAMASYERFILTVGRMAIKNP